MAFPKLSTNTVDSKANQRTRATTTRTTARGSAMTTQTEALKLALEALDQLTNVADTFSVSGVYLNEEVWAKKCLSDAYFAITTIEQALAQPEQEPVAWMHPDGRLWTFGKGFDKSTFTIPLYTTPPPCPTCEALARTVMMDQTGRDA